MRFLNYELYANPVYLWLIALGLVVLAWAALTGLKWFIVNRIGAWASRTRTQVDDFFVQVVARTRAAFVMILAVALVLLGLSGSRILLVPAPVEILLHRVLVIAVLIQATFWGTQVIDFAIARWLRRQDRHGASAEMEASLRTTLSAVRLGARITLYALVFLLILDNLGVNVTALVAGLGVGGIAVALAVQNILGDLFSSFSIVMDKPFVLGDFVIVGNEMGTVEKIGLKTTRIKSLGGEQIVFSNTDLLQSRVRNYKRMADRRIVFSFSVRYGTDAATLDQIPQIIREIVEAQENTRFDRAHFQSFGESGLRFEAVYYVTSPSYNVYAAIEHQINLALYRRLEEMGVSFAHAIRSLQIDQLPPIRVQQAQPAGQPAE